MHNPNNLSNFSNPINPKIPTNNNPKILTGDFSVLKMLSLKALKTNDPHNPNMLSVKALILITLVIFADGPNNPYNSDKSGNFPKVTLTALILKLLRISNLHRISS